MGWLHDWRARSGNKDAKLVLVGHSMGGLVSRYFLEVLGGWLHTRSLFTLGTPHRGAVSSYARLVKCEHSSAGKKQGTGGAKIGNVHLKWAFSEAAVGFLRKNPRGQRYLARLARKHGKSKALSVLAAKLGRAAYYMLTRRTAFEMEHFLMS